MASPKNVLDELPLKKRQLLEKLYEMPEYKVLLEAIELVRLNAAKHALDAGSIEDLRSMQGQALGLKLLVRQMEDLHRRSDTGKKKEG